MAQLPHHPTLAQLQQHIKDVCAERGWDTNTPLEIFLLFTEEVGELAKELRKANGMRLDAQKHAEKDLDGEFADVLAYLLDLANQYHVDLEDAYRRKMAKNETRTWHGDTTDPSVPNEAK